MRGTTRVQLNSGNCWTLVPAEKAVLRSGGASPFLFYGLFYLPCTVLPEVARVFFGQLSPGHDSAPVARKGVRPLDFLCHISVAG